MVMKCIGLIERVCTGGAEKRSLSRLVNNDHSVSI